MATERVWRLERRLGIRFDRDLLASAELGDVLGYDFGEYELFWKVVDKQDAYGYSPGKVVMQFVSNKEVQ